MTNEQNGGNVLDFREALIVSCCYELWSALYDADYDFTTLDRLAEFSNQLCDTFGTTAVMDCRLYHVLAGSTLVKSCSRLDFEGRHSILSFIENLARERVPETYAKVSPKLRGVK